VSPRGDAEVQIDLGPFGDVSAEVLERAVKAALGEGGAHHAEVSLALLDDDGIRALNVRYLGKDRPTDVLAFSLGTAEAPLGDVYIGVEQARRQADDLGVAREEELVRLAIHGTLHVLGHEHPEGEDRVSSPMFALQERLVARVLGAADP
jgi:probable rRNA maturation factor